LLDKSEDVIVFLDYLLELAFEFYEKSGTTDICRYSVASMVLKDSSLRKWFASEFRKKLRSFEFDLKELEFEGHELYHLVGRSKLSRHVREIFQTRRQLDGWIWRCAESDKIYVIRADRSGKQRLDTAPIAESITCCSRENRFAAIRKETTDSDA